MEKWFDNNYLIHLKPDQDSDNGIVFTVEYYILKHMEGSLVAQNIVEFVKAVVAHRRDAWVGMYWQRPGSTENKASHDNITSICCFSFLKDLTFHHTIKFDWSIAHPRDMVLLARLKGRTWSSLFMWIPILCMIATCLKSPSNTSGKLLAFIRLQCTKHAMTSMAITYWICTQILRLQYRTMSPWQEVFAVYFERKDHPNRVLSKRLDI